MNKREIPKVRLSTVKIEPIEPKKVNQSGTVSRFFTRTILPFLRNNVGIDVDIETAGAGSIEISISVQVAGITILNREFKISF